MATRQEICLRLDHTIVGTETCIELLTKKIEHNVHELAAEINSRVKVNPGTELML